jgi:hypothetical protein
MSNYKYSKIDYALRTDWFKASIKFNYSATKLTMSKPNVNMK